MTYDDADSQLARRSEFGNTAAGFFFLAHLELAIVDLLTEGKYAELMAVRCVLASNLAPNPESRGWFVWLGRTPLWLFVCTARVPRPSSDVWLLGVFFFCSPRGGFVHSQLGFGEELSSL